MLDGAVNNEVLIDDRGRRRKLGEKRMNKKTGEQRGGRGKKVKKEKGPTPCDGYHGS